MNWAAIYWFLARLTVGVYAGMGVAGWYAHRPKQAALALLFAVANALMFW